VAELLGEFPPRRVATDQGDLTLGLPVRLLLQRATAQAELDLGDEARFYPTDAALTRWRQGSHDQAAVVYE
jgi:DNA polymerase-3 subunit alpha